MGSNNSTISKLALGVGLAVSVGVAQGSEITLDAEYEDFSQGYYDGHISSDSGAWGVHAGEFGFETSNVQGSDDDFWLGTLEAFCVQIDTTLDQNSVVEYSVVDAETYFNDHFGGSARLDNVGSFYTGFRDQVQDSTTSAAFQLGLWELLYETEEEFKVTVGEFQTTYFDDSDGGVVDTANNWLGDLENFESTYSLSVLSAEGTQDVMVMQPDSPTTVPAPATLGLLALGLTAVGLRRRR